MRRLSIALFAASILLCLAHGAWYYPQLPDTVASRFNASGEPDATMSKNAALAVYYGVVLLLGAVMAGISLLTARMPTAMLNLPNKEHWLAESREAGTREFLSSSLLWLGTLTMVLMLVVFHLSYRVSLGLADRLPSVGLTVGIYGGLVVGWLVVFLLRFLRPAT